jgi:hypothetical protein
MSTQSMVMGHGDHAVYPLPKVALCFMQAVQSASKSTEQKPSLHLISVERKRERERGKRYAQTAVNHNGNADRRGRTGRTIDQHALGCGGERVSALIEDLQQVVRYVSSCYQRI